jgi:hypothetical protein
VGGGNSDPLRRRGNWFGGILLVGITGDSQNTGELFMPKWLEFLLYAAAFVCFLLAASGRVTARVNLAAAGLAAWVLVPLWRAWPG